MAMSNYDNGFAGGVTIRGVPLVQSHPGKVFWVSSAAASTSEDAQVGVDSGVGSFKRPYATLDYAVGKCKAGRGDIIFVKPGHTETLSSATALNLDIAGVAIVGLGSGSSRPTLTLDTATTTTIPVSAANISIKNIIITANFADIVSVFTLTTASDFVLDDVYVKATATDMNFLYIVDTNATTAAADGLTLSKVVWIEPDLATLSAIKMDGTNARVSVVDSKFVLGVNNNKAAVIAIATGKVCTALTIDNNDIYRLNTDTATGGIILTTDGSTNTGMVSCNRVQHADTAAEILVTASSGLGFFENRASGVAGASGYLLPAADS